MCLEFVKIFTDEVIDLEKVDGTKLNCIFQSSKNDLDAIQDFALDLQDLHEIIVTVKTEGNKRLDFPVRIKDIHSIERIT